MSKTKPEIAKSLLERRNRMSHVILPGEITKEIGPDGVAEALKSRWLVPDTDDGYLCVTHDLGLIGEMRKLAEMKPEQYAPDAIPVAESHGLAMLHTRRHSIKEVAAPMTGQPAPTLQPMAQPQAQAQPPQPGALAVGSQVMMARNGKSTTGVIEKDLGGERFQVGVPDGQPRPAGDNIYSKNELSLMPNTPNRPPGTINATIGSTK